MQGPAILDLLTRTPPSSSEIVAVLTQMDADERIIDVAAADDATERDLFCLANAVYFGGPLAARARESLRRRLSPQDYRNVIVFIAYNKMCHEWMAAHPEVSYELDQRYLQNFAPIAAEAPELIEILGTRGDPKKSLAPDFEVVATERAHEAARSAEISERRLNEVLHQLRERIASATQDARAKEQLAQELLTTSEFAQELLSIVSHDLRNPLNTIVMGTTLALRLLEPPPESVARPLERVIASARRAERLIHDLLDFSQARAGGGIPIHRRATSLHTLARAAADELEAARPDVTLTVTTEGDGSGQWDPDRLTQVIANLLANAASHGRAGAPIRLTTRVAEDGASIVVHHENANGPIPAELLPVLFEPFKRGIARSFSRTRSVGLGLYIVHQIVKGHGGRVEVASSGATATTTFAVHLSGD